MSASREFELTIHAEERMRRRKISDEWVLQTLLNPDHVEFDPDDQTLEHRMAKIPTMDNRVLRVICRPAMQPILVITVHFDRSMKGKL